MSDQEENEKNVDGENLEFDTIDVTNNLNQTNLTNEASHSRDTTNVKINAEVLGQDTCEGTVEEALLEKLISEKKEVKKQKNFIKLPTEPTAHNHYCIPENVGDDPSKKEEMHILCECHPNVAGAAVPTVVSFVNAPPDNARSEDTTLPTTSNKDRDIIIIPKNTNVVSKTTSIVSDDLKPDKTDKEKAKRKITPKEGCAKDTVIKKGNKVTKDASTKITKEIISKDNKGAIRKPSLIPKLTKAITVNRRSRDQSRENIQNTNTQNVRLNAESSSQLLSSNDRNKNSKILPPGSYIRSSHKELGVDRSGSNTINIASRMTGLQERLKATTSMLRQKMEDKDKLSSHDTENNSEVELHVHKSKQTVDDLYSNIAQLKNTVSLLSESDTFTDQRVYIEKLFKNISEIKFIANKLCDVNECEKPITKEVGENDTTALDSEKMKKNPANTKDNKIRIKFLNHEGKKKLTEGDYGRSEEVQTMLTLSPKLTSESLSSATLLSKIRDTDSMDGVFIPTFEPPVNMEDEEEGYGLDITITFPEVEHMAASGAESHLPVCVSDISAEALKKLRRCPKDFKLLMNFVDGKLSFQSGAGPANNFSIGPDLKFVANVDYKKSDVINIKPSTECLYSSQLIPVESSPKKSSVRSLKATDSELLFNVVNLPFLYKNPYKEDATGHKSCVTLRNEKFLSVTMIARQYFKSMPQIPSLTNIFEDQLMEILSKTAFQTQERKRKNRQNQKKRINSNTTFEQDRIQ